MAKESTKFCGVGFVGLLTIAFIVLKLTKVISWSWVWVLSPIWIDAALTVLILLVTFIVCAILDYKEKKNEKKR